MSDSPAPEVAAPEVVAEAPVAEAPAKATKAKKAPAKKAAAKKATPAKPKGVVKKKVGEQMGLVKQQSATPSQLACPLMPWAQPTGRWAAAGWLQRGGSAFSQR